MSSPLMPPFHKVDSAFGNSKAFKGNTPRGVGGWLLVCKRDCVACAMQYEQPVWSPRKGQRSVRTLEGRHV